MAISTIQYKNNFTPSVYNDKELYSKSLKFKCMIPYITDKMWKYIISNISEYDFKIFINEKHNTFHLQIPTCSFGSFLYFILKQYIIDSICDMNNKNILDIQINSYELSRILHKNNISIKHYILFIENVYRKLSSSPVNLTINDVNNNIKFKLNSKFRIKLYPFIVYVNCCFKKNQCFSFEEACKNSHTYCINEYIELGIPLTESIFNSIVLSGDVGILNKLLCYGLDYPKDSFVNACAHNKELVIDFIIKSNKDITFYTNLEQMFHYGFIEDCFSSLNFLIKYHPTILQHSYTNIQKYIDNYWLYLTDNDELIIKFYLSDELIQNRRHTFSIVQSNLVSHFIQY